MDERELDRILSKRRAVEKAPDGLAERIIAAAMRAEKKAQPTLKDRIDFLLALLYAGGKDVSAFLSETMLVPRPALVLSAVLLLGMLSGYSVSSGGDTQQSVQAESFSTYADVLAVMEELDTEMQNYEEWL